MSDERKKYPSERELAQRTKDGIAILELLCTRPDGFWERWFLSALLPCVLRGTKLELPSKGLYYEGLASKAPPADGHAIWKYIEVVE